MRTYYRYDKQSLSYKKAKTNVVYYKIALIIISTFLLLLLMGFIKTKTEVKVIKENSRNRDNIKLLSSKHFLYPKENDSWEDSVFNQYAKDAQLFLNMPSHQGTPLTGDMMSLAARNAYDSTGVLLPVELALSQAVWESSLGRKGRSPKNNPYNIGERDSGTTLWFDSTFKGVQEYYYWMCENYLSCRTLNELFYNFVNCSGRRYASNQDYEYLIRNSYYNIKFWLEKHR